LVGIIHDARNSTQSGFKPSPADSFRNQPQVIDHAPALRVAG
jgi:hypothetical protein